MKPIGDSNWNMRQQAADSRSGSLLASLLRHICGALVYLQAGGLAEGDNCCCCVNRIKQTIGGRRRRKWRLGIKFFHKTETG